MWKSLDRSVWKEETGPEKEDYLITWLRRRERQGRLKAMHSTCWSLRWSLSRTLLSKLPAGLRSQSSWSLATRRGLHAPWGVSVSRGQTLLLGVGSIILYLVIWNRVSWWTWGLTWLTRLAGWQAPVMPLIWLHQDWNYRLVPLRQAFHVDAGDPSSGLHGHVSDRRHQLNRLLHPSMSS